MAKSRADVKTNQVQIEVDKGDAFELVCTSPTGNISQNYWEHGNGCKFTHPDGSTAIVWSDRLEWSRGYVFVLTSILG